MPKVSEISIELQYAKHSDGRYHIDSVDVPGLRLIGADFRALQADLDEVVKDLLKLNCNFVVEELRWVPSVDDVRKQLDNPAPQGTATYIAKGMLAA